MGRRDATFCLYSGAGATGDQVAPLRSSLRGLHDAMAPWATGGACLNFLAGPDVTAADVRSSYLRADLVRLEGVRRAVDPAGLFRGQPLCAARM